VESTFVDRFETHTHQADSGLSLPYRLLRPAKPGKGQVYPLILFLHGAGERGNDNIAHLAFGLPLLAREDNMRPHPCFVVAPQCPADDKWADVEWGDERNDFPGHPTPALGAALELVESLADELPVDRRRIYVTGLSMGGYGTWDAATRRPDLFAAAVPICGGGCEPQARRLAAMPVWAFHGALDSSVKPSRSRNMIAALRAAGGAPRYTEFPEATHDSWTPAYSNPELYDWLFEQRWT
jgi:predicted peptidase